MKNSTDRDFIVPPSELDEEQLETVIAIAERKVNELRAEADRIWDATLPYVTAWRKVVSGIKIGQIVTYDFGGQLRNATVAAIFPISGMAFTGTKFALSVTDMGSKDPRVIYIRQLR